MFVFCLIRLWTDNRPTKCSILCRSNSSGTFISDFVSPFLWNLNLFIYIVVRYDYLLSLMCRMLDFRLRLMPLKFQLLLAYSRYIILVFISNCKQCFPDTDHFLYWSTPVVTDDLDRCLESRWFGEETSPHWRCQWHCMHPIFHIQDMLAIVQCNFYFNFSLVLQALSLVLLSAYYKFLGGFPVIAVAALLLYVGCYQVAF